MKQNVKCENCGIKWIYIEGIFYINNDENNIKLSEQKICPKCGSNMFLISKIDENLIREKQLILG